MNSKSLLSIIVPVYNEEEFVEAAVARALAAPLPEGLSSELVAVDDGSTDSSGRILDELAARFPGRMRVFRHAVNRGKGAAVRTAIEHAAGEFGIIQDSELEARMEQAGFRIERALPFNRITRPGWWLNGQVLRRETFGGLQLRVFDALVPLWRRIDHLLPWQAVSIVGIGAAE